MVLVSTELNATGGVVSGNFSLAVAVCVLYLIFRPNLPRLPSTIFKLGKGCGETTSSARRLPGDSKRSGACVGALNPDDLLVRFRVR